MNTATKDSLPVLDFRKAGSGTKTDQIAHLRTVELILNALSPDVRARLLWEAREAANRPRGDYAGSMAWVIYATRRAIENAPSYHTP
jgi:hypothetical protein